MKFIAFRIMAPLYAFLTLTSNTSYKCALVPAIQENKLHDRYVQCITYVYTSQIEC
jgi:hypothetical protein